MNGTRTPVRFFPSQPAASLIEPEIAALGGVIGPSGRLSDPHPSRIWMKVMGRARTTSGRAPPPSDRSDC